MREPGHVDGGARARVVGSETAAVLCQAFFPPPPHPRPHLAARARCNLRRSGPRAREGVGAGGGGAAPGPAWADQLPVALPDELWAHIREHGAAADHPAPAAPPGRAAPALWPRALRPVARAARAAPGAGGPARRRPYPMVRREWRTEPGSLAATAADAAATRQLCSVVLTPASGWGLAAPTLCPHARARRTDAAK